ncbi:hypothetical protein VTL71DRAFT_5957 [Oculimacula yallundae]|uniref:Uncharacterized protein n=1 Tax=Oculimacula yallundae TaxID=86028 RepID=A0ABR4BZ40_9HELO
MSLPQASFPKLWPESWPAIKMRVRLSGSFNQERRELYRRRGVSAFRRNLDATLDHHHEGLRDSLWQC